MLLRTSCVDAPLVCCTPVFSRAISRQSASRSSGRSAGCSVRCGARDRRRRHDLGQFVDTASDIERCADLLRRQSLDAGLARRAGDPMVGQGLRQALRRSAFKEAAAHLGKAIELADKLAVTVPSTTTASDRLRLQTTLGNALIWARGYQAPETSAACARAHELKRAPARISRASMASARRLRPRYAQRRSASAAPAADS